MKLLAIRLSALGDVAMTVPVIYSVAHRYPQLDITVLSRPFMSALFAGMPPNVRFRSVDFASHKGVGGLLRLYSELKAEGYDAVADLHDVLRTKLLRTLFSLSGKAVAHIDKGRTGRKRLTCAGDKDLRPLPTSFCRYEDVFARLGYPAETHFRSIYGEGKGDPGLFAPFAGTLAIRPLIGVAPFAAHPGKKLPETTAQDLIRQLAAEYRQGTIFLFGSYDELKHLHRWAEGLPNVEPVTGRLMLDGELALMSHLDVMVSMDSANMHLASLVGVPVVSVWGATHPNAGFMGWGQSTGNAVQLGLPCRPCSIFGNKPCRRGDYACLAGIRTQDIMKKVEDIVNTKKA